MQYSEDAIGIQTDLTFCLVWFLNSFQLIKLGETTLI